MSKKILWLDMDQVICDFLGKLCLEYNYLYNKNLKPLDIETWDLTSYIGKENKTIFQQPGFFYSLKPIKDAIKTIKLLKEDGNKIFIISNPPNEYAVYDKYRWVKEYLPFFDIKNLILIGNKEDLLTKINGNEDILLDDCPEYLHKFNGISVAVNMPYNQNVNCDFRIYSWEEFYRLVKNLETK
jgi:5'(3')-deoxyribonucleotidase